MASMTNQNLNARFLDANQEPHQVLLPIRGYAKEQLLSLDEAIKPINEQLDDLDIMVDTAKQNSKKPADGLMQNESAAIHLYTMQWEEPSVSLYTKLNTILRSERREPLKPWFRYLKLILTALFKLPSLRATVWRGVSGNLSDQYDDDVVWWGFSSCTESVDVMEQFVGKSGKRTLFNIECINGKAIRAHSFYKKESEILLLPGTYLRVVGKWSPAKDLYIIHLRETAPPRQYLEPPFATTPTETPVKQKSGISKDEEVLGAVAAASVNPKKKSQSTETSSSSFEKKLPCQGRACANCGGCTDWYWRHKGSKKNYIKRSDATCRYSLYGPPDDAPNDRRHHFCRGNGGACAFCRCGLAYAGDRGDYRFCCGLALSGGSGHAGRCADEHFVGGFCCGSHGDECGPIVRVCECISNSK